MAIRGDPTTRGEAQQDRGTGAATLTRSYYYFAERSAQHVVIVQGLLTLIVRQAGRLLNTVFGWATVMLFGKVPEDRQKYLSVLTFGSVAWLVTLIGVVVPGAATFMLAFAPLPDWVEEGWVQIAMIVGAVVIPLIVGAVSLKLVDPGDRPTETKGRAIWILKGYLYSLGLALTLLLMIVFAPILKVRDLVRRWTSTHIPIMVEPEDYLEVVSDVERVLKIDGIVPHRNRASWMIRLPTKVLTTFAGGTVENLSAEHLTTLSTRRMQVLLHPSDLVVSGSEQTVARVHALLTEHLTFTRAYLTWTKEANEFEDRLRHLWEDLRAPGSTESRLANGTDRLHAVEGEIEAAKLSYEEWEVLFREKLLVERGLLQMAAGVSERPLALSDSPREAIQRQVRRETVPTGPRPSRFAPVLAVVAGIVGIVLARKRLA